MTSVDDRIEDQKNRGLIREDKQNVTSILAEITLSANQGNSINYRVLRPNYLMPEIDETCVLDLSEEGGLAKYFQELRDGLDKVLTDGTMPEEWNERKDIAYHVREVARFYRERFAA